MPDESLLPESVTFDLASGNRVEVRFELSGGGIIGRHEWKYKPLPGEERAVDNFVVLLIEKFYNVTSITVLAEGPAVDRARIKAKTAAYLSSGRRMDPLSN